MTTTTKPLLPPSTSSAPPSAACAQGSKEGRGNTSFLILYKMGQEARDARRIMGVTQEAIRSTRYRIQQNMKK